MTQHGIVQFDDIRTDSPSDLDAVVPQMARIESWRNPHLAVVGNIKQFVTTEQMVQMMEQVSGSPLKDPLQAFRQASLVCGRGQVIHGGPLQNQAIWPSHSSRYGLLSSWNALLMLFKKAFGRAQRVTISGKTSTKWSAMHGDARQQQKGRNLTSSPEAKLKNMFN
ncbi:uncharacterized protein Z520_08315 [Fonsecaea multimorphosa CBS 102226]|uniref:Uncharacterized protein n=1 Tax=Fonsecaea multimorphosa CBS 102226 TaxID=1442371 RepID=A0A0D2H2G7_9EURO|nr:uncharacterized protein Z520_08315 [Fonsecaea multimorphosa CBS 102226]KIX96060.1 hypothetical protein Z520_08315 [Fonsecaea multimorphosa CBS 102226]OAL21826.1 hypothetical protein AYO22_07768 [Fonsecaea multimorphosa]